MSYLVYSSTQNYTKMYSNPTKMLFNYILVVYKIIYNMLNTDNQLKEISKRIRLKLKSIELSNKDFSKLVGVSENGMSKILNGTSNFKVLTLIEITDILNVSSEFILKGIDNVNDINELSRLKARIKELERDKERLYNILENK